MVAVEAAPPPPCCCRRLGPATAAAVAAAAGDDTPAPSPAPADASVPLSRVLPPLAASAEGIGDICWTVLSAALLGWPPCAGVAGAQPIQLQAGNTDKRARKSKISGEFVIGRLLRARCCLVTAGTTLSPPPARQPGRATPLRAHLQTTCFQ